MFGSSNTGFVIKKNFHNVRSCKNVAALTPFEVIADTGTKPGIRPSSTFRYVNSCCRYNSKKPMVGTSCYQNDLFPHMYTMIRSYKLLRMLIKNIVTVRSPHRSVVAVDQRGDKFLDRPRTQRLLSYAECSYGQNSTIMLHNVTLRCVSWGIDILGTTSIRYGRCQVPL